MLKRLLLALLVVLGAECVRGQQNNFPSSGASLPAGVTASSALVSNGAAVPPVYQAKPTLDARDFGTPTGSNAGTLIQAAHNSALCPSTGCVIDARGFGSTDAISGLNITKPIHLLLGATAFTLSGTNTFTNIAGLEIEGAGPGITTFAWAGGSAQMFRLISVARSSLSGFSLTCSTTTPCTNFFSSERGSSGNPTHVYFHNVQGDGTNGGVTDAFSWIVGAGGDAGNDTFQFDHVEFDNYSNACFNNSTSTQSQQQGFYNVTCSANGYGRFGYYGIGSFAAYNMNGGGNATSDFAVTSPNNGVLIVGGLFIGSARLYEDTVATSNTMPVTIAGVNWANNNMNASGYVIMIGFRGPYVISNNQVGGSAALPSQFLNYGTGTQNLIAIGNNIRTNLANPFTGGGWELIGNNINTGPPVLIPDSTPGGLQLTNGPAGYPGNLTFASGKGQHIQTQAASNDLAGTLATASSTTASVTFTTNYTAAPVCVLTPQTTGLTSWYLSAISVSGFTVTVAPSGTYTFGYICMGNPN
jgi:hypothetical protein